MTEQPIRGRSYAYTPPRAPLVEPLRVEVLDEPHDGRVHVRIFHPDLEPIEQVLRTGELHNEWDAVPEVDEAYKWAPGRPWKEIAEARYAQVEQQRSLARRLTALGIERKEAHYADRGGTSEHWSGMDAKLVLSPEELETLITLAELGQPPGEG